MKDTHTTKVLGFGVWLAAASLVLSPASAATFTWNGNGPDALWTDGANWVGGVAPGNTDSVVFGTVAPARLNVDLNGAVVVTHNITFDGNNAFVIGTASGGALVETGVGSSLTQNANVTSNSVINNIIFSPSTHTIWNINGGGGSRVIIGSGASLNDSGNNDITKTGSGMVEFDGGGTFGDDTLGISLTLNAGTVFENHSSGAGDQSVVVNAGVLGGTGAVLANANIGQTITMNGGTLAPGDPLVNGGVGTLTTFFGAGSASLVLTSSANLSFQLGAIGAGTTSDFVDDTNGGLTSAGTLQVTNLAGFQTGTYSLIHYGGVLVDNGMTLDPASYAALRLAGFNAYTWTDTTGQNIDLIVQTIPEPSTWLLLGCGLAGCLWMARKRTSKS